MTLKELIVKYGKEKINTLTKYPSILTLHRIGDKGKLTDELTTDIQGETMYATEKIDGTNVRIVCLGSEYLIGSRENIIHHCDDLYYGTDLGIVDSMRSLNLLTNKLPYSNYLTVIYGEFYGGKTSSNSKWYGQDKVGFRVFDVAQYNDLSILERPLKDISYWREHETDSGLIYGQNFMLRNLIQILYPQFELVPNVFFDLGDMSHSQILENLIKYIPSTNVALSDSATKKTEGLVLRNYDRSHIVKIRFEDYERTLK